MGRIPLKKYPPGTIVSMNEYLELCTCKSGYPSGEIHIDIDCPFHGLKTQEIKVDTPRDPGLGKHYKQHPSGVECIDITKHFNFCIGNAIKYLWRVDHKGTPIEDLKKALHYIEIEINRRETCQPQSGNVKSKE